MTRVLAAHEVREWKQGANWLPYVSFAQKDPDSAGTWWPVQASTLDDREWAKNGYHLRSPIVDTSVLERNERVELCELSNTPSTWLTDEQKVRERTLRSRLPRLTCSGAYDIDADDGAVADELARRIHEEEARRGAVLRESWSGSDDPTGANPTKRKRHLEWGSAVKGHPCLLYAMLGRARSVCLAVGLVQCAKNKYSLPDDPKGTKGCVDLVNLNRNPGSRDSQFRVLGGAHKQVGRAKVLVPGSSERGARITEAMLEEGLRLYDQQEVKEGRPDRKAREKFAKAGLTRIALPDTDTPTEFMRAITGCWGEDAKIDKQAMRLALSGTLVRSGLLSLDSIRAVLMPATTAVTIATQRNVDHILEDTHTNLRRGQAVAGSKSLRDAVGTPHVLALAYATHEDLGRKYSLMWVWEKLSPHATNTEKSLEAILKKIGEAIGAADRDGKKPIHRVRRRVQASSACGRRVAHGKCPLCKLGRCMVHLYCNDPSCAPCTNKKIRDVIDLLDLPRSCRSVVAAGFETKKAAQKVVNGLPKHKGKRPLVLYSPTADGTWTVTMLADEADNSALSIMGSMPGGETTVNLSRERAIDVVVMALLLKHAAARHAIETCDEKAVALLIDSYRKHTASTRNSSIHWPTKEEIREFRKRKALEAAAEKAGDGDVPDACDCPDEVRAEYPTVFEVHDDKGNVLLTDLLSPPTLPMVIAHEAGEPVRLHRKRLRWSFSRPTAGAGRR